MDWRFVMALLFAIVVSVFAIQNAESVSINFLQAHASMSQALVILISAVLGALIVLALSTIRWVRWSARSKSSLKTISKLEEEIKGLKLQLEEFSKKASPLNQEEALNPAPLEDSEDKDII